MKTRGRPKKFTDNRLITSSEIAYCYLPSEDVTHRTQMNRIYVCIACNVLKDNEEAVKFFGFGTTKLRNISVLIELGRCLKPEIIVITFKKIFNDLQAINKSVRTHAIAKEVRKLRLHLLEKQKRPKGN